MLVPAASAEAKAFETVRVSLAESQEQARLLLRSVSALEQETPSWTMSIQASEEASGLILGNTTYMKPPASTSLAVVKDTWRLVVA